MRSPIPDWKYLPGSVIPAGSVGSKTGIIDAGYKISDGTSFLPISYNNRRTVCFYLITHSLDLDVLFFGVHNDSFYFAL